jgi:hypothetical protein
MGITDRSRAPATVQLLTVPERVYQRIIHNADRDEATGCLVSRYSIGGRRDGKGSDGYSQIGWQQDGQRIVVSCHRALWVYLEGPIPDGMTVDHMCPPGGHNKRCQERKHLRLLTNFDNARRTFGRDWPLGQCANGHPDSLLKVVSDGRLRCPECLKQYGRNTRERKRQRTAESA